MTNCAYGSVISKDISQIRKVLNAFLHVLLASKSGGAVS
jgi:hypothetical protein